MSSGNDTRPSSLADTAAANSEASSKGSPGSKSRGKGREPRVQSKDRDMGSALRTVYQHAVEEAVPSEMLDLLSKLD